MRLQHWIYTLPLRLRSLFRRDRVEADLADEFRDHFDHLVAANLARGMTAKGAHLAAHRAMDGPEQRKEECRDARRVRYIEDFFKDLKFGLRTMRRSPAFALTAVISLALGIGANSAIFTAVDAVVWKPLPVEHPETLVRLGGSMNEGRELDVFPASLADALRRPNDAYSDAITVNADGLSFAYDGRAERVLGECVSPNFFGFFGLKMAIGQPFSPAVRDDHWAPEVVLSYRFWQRRFGGSADVIGRVVHLNTYPFTIVGVSPASFYDQERGLDPELRIPVLPEGQKLSQMNLITRSGEDFLFWNIMARRKPGVSLARASAFAGAQFQELMRQHPAVPRLLGLRHVRAIPGDKGWPRYLAKFTTPLFVLFGLVGGVLLIACANVANMLLARAAARRRELAVRCSIGAGRARLIRQMLAESLLLSFAGGGVGILAAFWMAPQLIRFLPRSNITLALDLHPDVRALWFTSALAVLTGILFGLVPALKATRGDLSGSMKSGAAASTGDRESALFRKVLVCSQVALSLALLVTAGLFVRTLVNLRPQEMAVNPDRVLQFMIKPQEEIYSDAQKYALTEKLLRRVSEVSGVESATLAHPGPFAGVELPQPLQASGGNPVNAVNDQVTGGIFHTFGIKVIAGRDFGQTDKPGAPLVAVINQTLARGLYGDANPIGRTFTRRREREQEVYQVIGMVADVHYYNLYGPPEPMAFYTFQTEAPYMPVLHVRTNNPDTAGMTRAILRAIDDVDRGFPVFNLKTMSMQLDDALARERLVANLAAAFGILAMALAAIGLYGVLAYSVTRRTREIGIRMALGSGATSAVWLVANEALRLVAIGCAVGMVLALAGGRLITGQLFGVSTMDPATLFEASAVMMAIAALAVCVPALRASRVNPVTALRCE